MTATIPRHPADVTPAWLGSVLGADVRDVDVSPIGTGQTGATYRVAATYGAEQHGLPNTFAIKLPALDDDVRTRVAQGYLSEFEFYSTVAGKVRVPVPRCYHCEIAGQGSDFALLLADMAPAEQGDQITGCTPQQARLAVEALAGLHGPSWCDRSWFGLSAIAMPKPGDDAAGRSLGDVAKMAADMTLDKLGAAMTPADRDTLVQAMSVVTPWLSMEPARYSLMHGDYRLDNMLFDPDGSRVTVVDWQTVGLGLPARDLAYFTGTSLVPEVRAAIEEDLVNIYHRALLDYGVTDYDLDTCWRDYLLGFVQVPLLCALGCAFATSTERGDQIMVVMLERGCQAIRELDTLELIA
jgi:aminoglycoside phosphotransferase (APT) family kinase protein